MGRTLTSGARALLVQASGVLFVILGLVVFADLAQVQHEPTAGDLSSQLNGVLAATLMGSVFVALLTIVRCVCKCRWTVRCLLD